MSKPVSQEHSLFKRYSFKLISNIAGVPLYLVMESVLPRALGPTAYGNFNYATNAFQNIINFLDFGSSACLFTALSKRQNEWGLLSFFWRVGVLVLAVVLLASGLCMVPKLAEVFMPGVPFWVPPFAALWAYGFWGVRVLRGINDALGQTVRSEKARTLAGIIACAALVGMYFAGVLSLPTAFAHQLVYLFGMLSIFKIIVLEKWGGWRNLNVPVNPINPNEPLPAAQSEKSTLKRALALSPQQRKEYIKEFVAYSMPLFWQSVAVLLSLTADRWLLQVFGGGKEQGYFSLAQKVGMACFLFVSAMVPLLTRELAVAHGKADYKGMGVLLQRFAPLLMAVSTYFSAFVCVEAENIIKIFGGSEYASAFMAVQIMALFPIHQGYTQICHSVFYASNKTAILSKVNIAACILSTVATAVILLPKSYGGFGMGAVGLAAKSLILQFISCNIFLYICSKIVHVKMGRLLLHQLVCIVAFLVLAFLVKNLAVLLPGFLGSGMFGLEGAIGTGVGFVARGAVYTVFCAVLFFALPWVWGLAREDARKVWQKITRAK